MGFAVRKLMGLLVVGLALGAEAASPPPPVLLTVKRSRGSADAKERAFAFEISLRNGGTNTVPVDLEWYFVSSPIGGFGYYVSSRGKQSVKLEPRKTFDCEKSCPLIVTKDVKGKGGKTAKQEVAQTKGYIVRLFSGGKLLDTQSEPSFIKRKALDPEEFKALLATPAPEFK